MKQRIFISSVQEDQEAQDGTPIGTKVRFPIVRSQSIIKHISCASKEICIYQDLRRELKEEINRKKSLVVQELYEVYG